MGAFRFRRILKKDASTLLETLVAMVMVALVGVMMASGIMTSLKIYTSAADIQRASTEAQGALFLPDQCTDDRLGGPYTGYGEYFRTADQQEPITTYSYTVLSKTPGSADGNSAVLWYYPGEAD